MKIFVLVVLLFQLSGCGASSSNPEPEVFKVGQWVPAWDNQFRGKIEPTAPRPSAKTTCRRRVLYYPGDRPSQTAEGVPINQIQFGRCKTERKPRYSPRESNYRRSERACCNSAPGFLSPIPASEGVIPKPVLCFNHMDLFYKAKNQIEYGSREGIMNNLPHNNLRPLDPV